MFILDGNPLPLDTQFTVDGITYPPNWLRLATPEDRARLGITEVPDQPRPDDRFYWVSGPDDQGNYTAIPKDLPTLKETWSAQFKQTAYSMLLPSDWMIVRKTEDGTAIPADWTSYREAVRTTCALAISDMEATTDIDAFIASVNAVQWPVSPDQQAMFPAPVTPEPIEPAPVDPAPTGPTG
jgi:hypothetical protein